MKPALQASDFELMGLPEQYAVDVDALEKQWKSLMREAHPDRFAAEGAASQRLAMQWSVRINEAYQRLKDPVKRATYLCERWGVPVDAERNTAMPTDFLMQQMEWREELDDHRRDADALEDLLQRTRQARRDWLDRLADTLDGTGPSTRSERAMAAVAQVRALMFIERFATEINQSLSSLES